MRRTGDVRANRGATALLAAALAFALTLLVASDAPLEHRSGSPDVASAMPTDDVPAGVLPEVAALALVWLAVTVALRGESRAAHGRAQPRRDRAPPGSFVSA